MGEIVGQVGLSRSHQIVAATLELIREGGRAAVTTRAVAERAQVQAPTIYRLFGDKDGLVDAVADHAMAAYLASKGASDDTIEDPVDALRTAWERHISFGLDEPELYQMLSLRGSPSPAAGEVIGVDHLRHHLDRIAASGRLRVGVDRALAMIHAAGHGAVLTQLEQTPDARDPAVPSALFESVLGAITTPDQAIPFARDAEQPSSGKVVAVTNQLLAVAHQLPLTRAEALLLEEWLRRAVHDLNDIPTSSSVSPGQPAG